MATAASAMGRSGKSRVIVAWDLYTGNTAFRFLLNFSVLGWLTLVCLYQSGGLAPGASLLQSLPFPPAMAAAQAPARPVSPPPQQARAEPTASPAASPPSVRAALAQVLDAPHAGAPAQPRFADLNPADAPAALRSALADVASAVPERMANGLVTLSRAAGEGDASAMTAYGLARLAPPGAQPADAGQGRMWLQRAADAGQPHAAAILARAYLSGGAGFVDRPKAEELLRRAAQLGDPEAGLQLAALRAVNGGPEGVAESERLLRVTAEHGDLNAQRTLGRYLTLTAGAGGLDEAAVWLTRAADRGDAAAMESLGDLHLYLAKAAPLQDPARGVAWYRRCADSGRAACRYALGRSYRLALGVAADRARAWALLTLARDSGEPRAAAELRLTEQSMTPTEHANGMRALQEMSQPGAGHSR